MNCLALTGISPGVIAEVKQGKPRTLELQSAHNIITITTANPGDCLFLTQVDLEDLSPGDSGIIVEMISINISMKRLIEMINPLYYEERERMSARVQVKFLDSTHVKSVEGKDWVSPTSVDVIKSSCYHAH
jgi:hypothetical protein